MPRILYVGKKFSADTKLTIARANQILTEYEAAGYDLTLRQLYYQFVARGLIRNKDSEYKRLGSIVNDARMAGLIDWHHITDRTRNLRSLSHWGRPSDIIESAAHSFRIDKWATQPYRVEVWIEKDALVGVIGGVCQELDVPYFSCRGYTSQSEMWAAAQRLGSYIFKGTTEQKVKILHLGDHDPSGIDMTRDIDDRIERFIAQDAFNYKIVDGDEAYAWTRERFSVERLALNMDQIREYDPPPNPAKLTDSRGAGYVEKYGDESWELDALEPTVIGDLIDEHVRLYRDEELWDVAVGRENEHRRALDEAAKRWPEVATFLNGNGNDEGQEAG